MDQIQAEQTSGAATRQPLVVFHRFVPQARLPQRADRSALGSMPTRAFRYCEAITSAAAFGYYVFSPIDFSLMWDGTSISWTYKGAEGWMPLGSAQFPGFGPHFDATAPEGIQGFAPPFVSAIQEPGLVQLWSGLVVRTAPGTSLLLRAPANLPHKGGYELYEGIIETDRWFGPLFAALRLTRTHAPVEFSAEYPLFQVQPLPRETYADATLNDYELVPNLDQLDGKDWDDYYDTVVRPNVADKRPRGSYAAAARKRRAAEPDPA
jgi:Family of unknown function (DUF6065)